MSTPIPPDSDTRQAVQSVLQQPDEGTRCLSDSEGRGRSVETDDPHCQLSGVATDDENRGYRQSIVDFAGRVCRNITGAFATAATQLSNAPTAAYNKVTTTAGTKVDQFVSSRMGVDITNESERDQWRTLLTELLTSYAGMTASHVKHQFHFDEIIKKREGCEPITITGVSFDATRVTDHPESYLICKQATQSHFKVGRLAFTANIPVAEGPPLVVHMVVRNAEVSFATDLTLGGVLMSRLGQAAADRTAIQLAADSVEILYENPGIQRSVQLEGCEGCKLPLTTFDSGSLTLKGVRFCKPVGVLTTASEQTSVFSFSSLSCENRSLKPVLVEVKRFAINHRDEAHNGSFSARVIVHPRVLQVIPRIGPLLSVLFPTSCELLLEAPLTHGELSLRELKNGLTITGGGLFGWLMGKVLHSPTTRLVSQNGGTALQIGWPVRVCLGAIVSPGLMGYLPLQESVTTPMTLERVAQVDPVENGSDVMGNSREADLYARGQGVVIVPDLLSELLCNVLSPDGRSRSEPVRTVPRLLENCCIAAAHGDSDASGRLLRFVRDQERFGHNSDCMMALQAIPADYYKEVVSQLSGDEGESEIDWDWLERMAHKLTVVDRDKAVQLYRQLLMKRDLVQAHFASNDLQWLVHLSKSLPRESDEERDLAIKVAQFCIMSDLDGCSEILDLLLLWYRERSFSAADLKHFIEKLISEHPVYQSPHRLAELAVKLERHCPEAADVVLTFFPLARFVSEFSGEIEIAAHSTLEKIRHLLIRHQHYQRVAELLLRVGRQQEIADVLEEGIGRGHPGALRTKYTLLGQGISISAGDGYVQTIMTECRQLVWLMHDSEVEPAMKVCVRELLAELILEGKHSELAALFADTPWVLDSQRESLRNALDRLFSLRTRSLSSLQGAERLLDELERTLRAMKMPVNGVGDAHAISRNNQHNLWVDELLLLLDQISLSVDDMTCALAVDRFDEATIVDNPPSIANDWDVLEEDDDALFEDAIDTPWNGAADLSVVEDHRSDEAISSPVWESDRETETLSRYGELLSQPVYRSDNSGFADPHLQSALAAILSARVI